MEKVKDIKRGMSAAYQVAHEMLRDRLEDVDENMVSEFDSLSDTDVVVSRGKYDFIEQVFNGIGLKYTMVDPLDFDSMSLHPDQIVFINCPGELGRKGIRQLVTFVEKGGFLFTTDWALRHVLERAFPSYVKHNGEVTSDEVVRVEFVSSDDPFLKTLMGSEDDPQWWLEGSSYPIKILDRKKVDILIKSKELGGKYGESAIFVTFDHGEGKVYHMISHFYLQRSETRTKRHAFSGEEYLKEKLEMNDMRSMKYEKMGIRKSNLAEVESAYASSSMMQKVLWDKKKKSPNKDER